MPRQGAPPSAPGRTSGYNCAAFRRLHQLNHPAPATRRYPSHSAARRHTLLRSCASCSLPWCRRMSAISPCAMLGVVPQSQEQERGDQGGCAGQSRSCSSAAVGERVTAPGCPQAHSRPPCTPHLDHRHLPEELVHVLVRGLRTRRLRPRLHIPVAAGPPLQGGWVGGRADQSWVAAALQPGVTCGSAASRPPSDCSAACCPPALAPPPASRLPPSSASCRARVQACQIAATLTAPSRSFIAPLPALHSAAAALDQVGQPGRAAAVHWGLPASADPSRSTRPQTRLASEVLGSASLRAVGRAPSLRPQQPC